MNGPRWDADCGLHCYVTEQSGRLVPMSVALFYLRHNERSPQLNLEYEKKEDFDAIAKCTSLEHLTLARCPNPDFYEWRNLPIRYIKFWNYCKINELKDMIYLKPLTTVMVGACRKFERFSGDNSNIKDVTVDGCRLFDINSLTTLPNVENVSIISCAKEIAISELPNHPTITKLELSGCKLIFDTYNFKEKMPNLKKLWLSNTNTPESTRELIRQANNDNDIVDSLYSFKIKLD